MRTILNRLILLLYSCVICVGIIFLGLKLGSKPFTLIDLLKAIAIALVGWIALLLFSKGKFLKDWPFKDQQSF